MGASDADMVPPFSDMVGSDADMGALKYFLCKFFSIHTAFTVKPL